MIITGKKLWALAGGVVLCIIASLLITFAGVRPQSEEKEYSYYYTNYEDPSALFALEITNSSGDMTLASVDGEYLAIGDYELTADKKNAEFFFRLASQVPLEKKLEDASAADPQYGLTESSAEVLIIDQNQNPKCFEIGTPTPDGSGYYSCLYGDDTVYVLGSDFAECFLDDVTKFYDLSFYPELSGEVFKSLESVEISNKDRSLVFRNVTPKENEAAVYFRMQSPYELLLSSDQSKNVILSGLNQIKGTGVANISPAEFDRLFAESSRDLYILTFENGIKYNLRVIYCANDAFSYIYSDNGSYVFEVPTSLLGFTHYSPADFVGNNLLDFNMSVIESITIGRNEYRISRESDKYTVTKNGQTTGAEDFRSSVLSTVNHISVQEQYTNERVGAELISISFLTNISQNPAELTFYESDNGKCVAAINGKPAFICGTTAVVQLLQL